MEYLLLLILTILVVGFSSYLISRAVYRSQVKNEYKNPGIAATIVFILAFAIMTAAVFLLVINNIRITR